MYTVQVAAVSYLHVVTSAVILTLYMQMCWNISAGNYQHLNDDILVW